MSRTYSTTKCIICDKTVSRNGLAYISHMRKHVREDKIIEKKDRDGYIYFLKNRPCVACGFMLSAHIGPYNFCPNPAPK